MNEAEYNTWLEDCLAHLVSVNTLADKQFSIGNHERWDMSQETGQFTFSDHGKTVVWADAQIIGTFSFVSLTWLWGWANESILPKLTQEFLQLKEYGQEHEIQDLVEPGWPGEEQDAWAMAAVALKLLGGQAVYRGPSENGLTFILLRNLRNPEGP